MANSKELAKAIEELHKKQKEEMEELSEQRTEALKVERYDEGAMEIKNMYDSYIRAGFTEEQAWELITILVSNGTKKTLF